MRFFQYETDIINLNNVTNFTCTQQYMPEEGDPEPSYVLIAHLNYSHGYWDKEEMCLGAQIIISEFESQADGLKVARDIIAGEYDIPVGNQSPTHVLTPDETETAEPTETQTETSETSEPAETKTTEEQQPDDPKEKEKVIQSARELFKNPQTKVIATELGINTLQVYNKAQEIWGKSNKWSIEQWNNYTINLANFQQRNGELYDKLKPQNETTEETTKETTGTQNGNGKGPF